jgi:D-threo-aldose 1-dehydrogenase
MLRQLLDGGMQGLADAKAQGLIRAIGIGVNETAVCFEMLERTDLDCILLAGRYTLMEQPALTSGLLDLCALRGVTVIIGGVFNSGLLAEYPSETSTYDYAAPSAAVLERARGVWALCQSFSVEPQAAALHFVLDHPAVACAIVGARSSAEIVDLARWCAGRPPAALWDALKENGYIDKAAPTGRRGEN